MADAGPRVDGPGRRPRSAQIYSAAVLDLTADDVLTTTRAVRKRLDLARPVPADLVRECVAAALQAPSGSNNLTMQFVVVTDEATRRAIGEVYRQCYEIYKGLDGIYVGSIVKATAEENAQQHRVQTSADYLGDHMGEAPTLVIACNAGGRVDGVPAMVAASALGNILPATWSFMLAARARGLGTAWTSVHLMMEQQVADIVGIPFAEVQQVCLTPLAYTVGTDFKPATRPDPDTIIHWDSW
jgi:nitroreductase